MTFMSLQLSWLWLFYVSEFCLKAAVMVPEPSVCPAMVKKITNELRFSIRQ